MTSSLNFKRNYGYFYALAAAVLFGASTPASKLLLAKTNPWLLAGLLYFGSGIGLVLIALLRTVKRNFFPKEASLRGSDWKWLGGAVLFGGILGPVFLMMGLARTSATSASLFLNLEGVLTALVAWVFFKEHFDRRIALGMLSIFAGGLILSWTSKPSLENLLGPALIASACLSWAIDNNLTRKISASDPLQISMIKCLLAGGTNILLALGQGSRLPSTEWVFSAAVIGFLGYGISLFCFILALRHIGTSRTGAYFAFAPFIGAGLSLLFLRESLSFQFISAGILMAFGLWLHLTERHAHEHEHEPMEHEHRHVHDEHHRHQHGPHDPPGEPHTHWHRHERLKHMHIHYPDIHHRHGH